MNRKEIHFVIDRDGNVQSTIKGMKGSTCDTIAKEIEKLGQVVKQERTKEFYELNSGKVERLDVIDIALFRTIR